MKCGLICGCVEAQMAREAIKIVFDIGIATPGGAPFEEPEEGHESIPRGVLGALFLKAWSGRLASEAGRVASQAKRNAKEFNHAARG